MIFIANSDNFLKRVAGIVLEKIRELKDPLQIPQMRVYLPNNRSCRILKEYLKRYNLILRLYRKIMLYWGSGGYINDRLHAEE